MIRPLSLRTAASTLALAGLGLAAPALAKRDATPGFSERSLDLPGIPATVIPADMNGDGREDLVVLVVYSAWGDTVTTEQATFDDVEGLVEVMNVVSALIDHRELRVYPADGDGGYGRPAALELDASIHVLEAAAGPDAVLALTDEGVAAVRYEEGPESPTVELVPLVDTETALTGTGAFFADFSILDELDGDGREDLLLPTATGWTVFRGTADGFETEPASRVTRAERDDDSGHDRGRGRDRDRDGDSDSDRRRSPRPPERPIVADHNADGKRDLLVMRPGGKPVVHLNLGDLAFSAGVKLTAPGDEVAGGGDDVEEIVHVGSLDGGKASAVVVQTEVEPGEDAGMRVEIEHAKEPDFSYGIYPLDASLAVGAEPRSRFLAEGYTFAGSDDPGKDVDIQLPGGFKDLDGDGRQDLVAITLEFSIVPMLMRALVTRRLSLTMDFHPWCQQENGSFRRVPGLDLSGKFKINMRNVQVKHLSQFAGDFDGDGRADFVQLGRGRNVTIHHGGPGCSYPVQPSAKIRLAKEPRHLGLVRILDLNGDDRSDLYVVQPLKKSSRSSSGESSPVRIDLYLSDGS